MLYLISPLRFVARQQRFLSTQNISYSRYGMICMKSRLNFHFACNAQYTSPVCQQYSTLYLLKCLKALCKRVYKLKGEAGIQKASFNDGMVPGLKLTGLKETSHLQSFHWPSNKLSFYWCSLISCVIATFSVKLQVWQSHQGSREGEGIGMNDKEEWGIIMGFIGCGQCHSTLRKRGA